MKQPKNIEIFYNWRNIHGDNGAGSIIAVVPNGIAPEAFLAGFKAGYEAYGKELDARHCFTREEERED